MSDPIARLVQQSGEALMRHWPIVAPRIGLAGTRLVPTTDDFIGPLRDLIDAGAGVDFLLSHGRRTIGIAARVQWDGVFRTLTLRDKSEHSELARACQAFTSEDMRLRPEWCVHVYESCRKREGRIQQTLVGFVAARAFEVARYYLALGSYDPKFNGHGGDRFAAFAVPELRRAGVDVREYWPELDPEKASAEGGWRLQ